jgi:hypothetical protein
LLAGQARRDWRIRHDAGSPRGDHRLR